MKPFLGIDISENSKNEIMNGDEFVAAKASDEVLKRVEETSAEAMKHAQRAKLPLFLRIIMYVFGVVAAMIFISIFRAITESESDLTIKEAYRTAPYLFWIFGICAVLFCILELVSYARKRRVLGSEEARAAFIKADMAVSDSRAELAVPEYAPLVDILLFKYKIGKNGRTVPKPTALDASPYLAYEVYMYKKDGMLCLADYEQIWNFPLDEIKALTRVNKKAVISNRDKEIIKQYKDHLTDFKMSTSENGLITSPIFILEISHLGEEYGIYLPCYSRPAVEELTELKASDKDEIRDEDGEDDGNDNFSRDSDFDMPSDIR